MVLLWKTLNYPSLNIWSQDTNKDTSGSNIDIVGNKLEKRNEAEEKKKMKSFVLAMLWVRVMKTDIY